ncbi:MAG: hypothetical protein IPQ09_24860 [Myxococcales bacterium]|nr:hypothetical protein [Myxococcales bacterium]
MLLPEWHRGLARGQGAPGRRGAPLCFHVDRVSFSFSVEAHDPGPDAAKEALHD